MRQKAQRTTVKVGHSRRNGSLNSMQNEKKADSQHYVPRLLIRRHSINPEAARGTEQVYCYDKSTDKIFPTNIKNVFAGTRYYDPATGTDQPSIDPTLTRIEAKAAPVLERLVKKQALSQLTREDRTTISIFLAVQFARTQAAKDYIRTLNRKLTERLQEITVNGNKIEGLLTLSDQELNDVFIKLIVHAPENYSEHFFSKHWFLLESCSSDPFYLGDHPVVSGNAFEKTARSAVGLASPGVCIYLPLSPTLCLGLSDPSVINELRAQRDRGIREHKKIMKRAARIPENSKTTEQREAIRTLLDDKRRMDSRLLPMLNGHPIPYNSNVVMHINSLQVAYASRWVVCSRNDFALTRRMIGDNNGFRSRFFPRATIE